ncbi:hypothetical protein HMPREF1013_02431 [Bacillus sp. 2_A_57_CT2]|nr:hypothetical protein HMPREF1013_02431 [Bacillus sp. 2_A_57_CT2]
MKVDWFDFHLPEELIAQTPLADRTSSRLMVLDKKPEIFSIVYLKILNIISKLEIVLC